MNSSNRVDQRPSIQFYVKDWLSEPGLRLCDLSARGLWIDLLCHLFQMPERGVLRVKKTVPGQANPKQTPKQTPSKLVALLVGRPEAEVEAALEQLLEHDVASTREDGTLYSRRMVRDEELRKVRARAGSMGGKASVRSKRQAKGQAESTPSSSSSSSSATSTTKEDPPTPQEPGSHPAHQKAVAAYELKFGTIPDLGAFGSMLADYGPGCVVQAIAKSKKPAMSYLRAIAKRLFFDGPEEAERPKQPWEETPTEQRLRLQKEGVYVPDKEGVT